MDSPEFTNGGDAGQGKLALQEALNRRRVSAIRDFKDVLDRARDDLAFEIGKVIRNASDDAIASFATQQAIKRAVREYDWVLRREWRAFQRALADDESRS